jgi:hypothetical protein
MADETLRLPAPTGREVTVVPEDRLQTRETMLVTLDPEAGRTVRLPVEEYKARNTRPASCGSRRSAGGSRHSARSTRTA